MKSVPTTSKTSGFLHLSLVMDLFPLFVIGFYESSVFAVKVFVNLR